MTKYQETHPWIDFQPRLDDLPPSIYVYTGQCFELLQMMSGLPLPPSMVKEFRRTYIAKGAMSTTAIEGNTLSEAQVRAIMDGELDLPPVQRYLQQEVENMLEAFQTVEQAVLASKRITVIPELLCQYNGLVMKNLKPELGPVFGKLRTVLVGVGNYIAPDPADCPILVDRFCEWLNSKDINSPETPQIKFAKGFIKALLAHLYVAWIHPFEDGNGRTARLLEYHLLLETGLPVTAAHLMADHYNLTRPLYYHQLALSSKVEPYSPVPFIRYGLEGLQIGLKEQTEKIKQEMTRMTWENFVRDHFDQRDRTPNNLRQQRLALKLPLDRDTDISGIPSLDVHLGVEYYHKSARTLSRDISQLEDAGLIARKEKRIRPNLGVLARFVPPQVPRDEHPAGPQE